MTTTPYQLRTIGDAATLLGQFAMRIGNALGSSLATNTNLLGSVKASSQTASVSFTSATPTVVTWTAHGLSAGATVYFTAAAMPTGLSASTTYYVSSAGLTTNTFQISSTLALATAGTSLAATSTGTTVVGFAGGLVLGAIPGITNGSAVPAGYVGEYFVDTNFSGTLTTSYSNLITRMLQPGIWDMSGLVTYSGAAGNVELDVAISTNSASLTGTTSGYDSTIGTLSSTNGTGDACIPKKIVRIASPTTYYLVGRVNSVSSAVTASMVSVRIA